MLTYILAGISCIGGAGNWSQNGQVTIMARGPNLGTSPLQSSYAGSKRKHTSNSAKLPTNGYRSNVLEEVFPTILL